MEESGYEKIEYITSQDKKKKYWNMAVGLQRVDNLRPSEYLKELAIKNVEGEITNKEVETLLYTHYQQETPEEKIARTKECDIVSNRIVELLEMDGVQMNPSALKSIHRYLFQNIYDDAGEFRTFNIRKKEPILQGDTVKYANYFSIEDTLDYDFKEEKKQNYESMNNKEVLTRISNFTSSIWQVHPFSEGNTRTTAVFIERYLNTLGFQVNNNLFEKNAEYFRNALVRSNYANMSNSIAPTQQFLTMFFDNLLYEGKNELNLKEQIIDRMNQKAEGYEVDR